MLQKIFIDIHIQMLLDSHHPDFEKSVNRYADMWCKSITKLGAI